MRVDLDTRASQNLSVPSRDVSVWLGVDLRPWHRSVQFGNLATSYHVLLIHLQLRK